MLKKSFSKERITITKVDIPYHRKFLRTSICPTPRLRNNDYDHNCENNLYNKNEHHDDIEDLDNNYHINDQKLELFKDHNKDNCDSQEYYQDHGHNVGYHKNNDHGQ